MENEEQKAFLTAVINVRAEADRKAQKKSKL